MTEQGAAHRLIPAADPGIKRIFYECQRLLFHIGKAWFLKVADYMGRNAEYPRSLVNLKISSFPETAPGLVRWKSVYASFLPRGLSPCWNWQIRQRPCSSFLWPVQDSWLLPGDLECRPGIAPFAKNFAPYPSKAIAIPIEFFVIVIGEYPTNPSKPSPGIWSHPWETVWLSDKASFHRVRFVLRCLVLVVGHPILVNADRPSVRH